MGKYALYAVAIVLIVWSGIWLRTGFYLSELPVIAIIGIAGLVALVVAKRMPTRRPDAGATQATKTTTPPAEVVDTQD